MMIFLWENKNMTVGKGFIRYFNVKEGKGNQG
jgi:hypothetical protein